MTCTCGCADAPTIADIRRHRAVKAGTRTLYKMREFREAERHYAEAKEKRAEEHRNGRLGTAEERECKDASRAVRDVQGDAGAAEEEGDEAEGRRRAAGGGGGE